MRLGELLVQTGRVSQSQVDAALRQQRETPGRRLGDLLVDDGALTAGELLQVLGEQFHMEVLDAIDEAWVDPSLVSRLPVDWARTRKLIPLRRENRVIVALADPAQSAAMDDLQIVLGMDVDLALAAEKDIMQAIERSYFGKTDTPADFLRELPAEPTSEAAPRREDLLRTVDAAPVTHLINLILLEALKTRASDVHVEPFEHRLRIRYRIDGLLYDQSAPPKALESALVSRLKVMARLDIAEKRLPQDGAARVRVGEREMDIRVSTVPVAEGERVVLRLLNRESALLPLPSLGLAERDLVRFREALRVPSGVVLVTGPTGSGKTTTLYAAMQELDTAHQNVLTIEDPIEYQLPDISQIQVHPKIGLTFAQGLRHILRQDPDVILVGETRDLETAEIVIRAALTGHLVFSTLHTNDAVSAVVRLVDMGIEPYLLPTAVRAVLAQRLVRTLCPACRRPANLTPDEAQAFGPAARMLEGQPLWGPFGCPACRDGYRGRTGLYELLMVDDPFQDALRACAEDRRLQEIACRGGMRTLLEDGADKVLSGLTSVAEVLRAAGREQGTASA